MKFKIWEKEELTEEERKEKIRRSCEECFESNKENIIGIIKYLEKR